MLYLGNHKIELTDLTNLQDSNVTAQILRSFALIWRKGEVYMSLKIALQMWGSHTSSGLS